MKFIPKLPCGNSHFRLASPSCIELGPSTPVSFLWKFASLSQTKSSITGQESPRLSGLHSSAEKPCPSFPPPPSFVEIEAQRNRRGRQEQVRGHTEAVQARRFRRQGPRKGLSRRLRWLARTDCQSARISRFLRCCQRRPSRWF